MEQVIGPRSTSRAGQPREATLLRLQPGGARHEETFDQDAPGWDGLLVESGTHAELHARENGLYRHLAELQFNLKL